MSFSALLPGFRMIAAPDTAAMEQIYRLRVRAWRARNASFPDLERWADAEDEDSLHWCIVDGRDAVVAAARLSLHPRFDEIPDAEIYPRTLAALTGPFGSINRLVVCPDHGGAGFSRVLDEARIAAASTAGCRFVVGATRAGASRSKSLEKLGFRALGHALQQRSGPLALANGAASVFLLELEGGGMTDFVAPGLPGGRSQ